MLSYRYKLLDTLSQMGDSKHGKCTQPYVSDRAVFDNDLLGQLVGVM